ATDEIAEQMGIAPHDALLLITRIGYTSDQRAIELTDTYCRNDYYDFVVELRK
ncbi:UTRA domain-containing protein, partial [Ralstonia pickettii]|nr:UTRA domain-containing protein [Ralstonia pickettii]